MYIYILSKEISVSCFRGLTVYPCDKWEYASTEAGSLKWHIKNKYEGGPKTWDFENNLETFNEHSNKAQLKQIYEKFV